MSDFIRLVDLANTENAKTSVSTEQWEQLRSKAQQEAIDKLPKEYLGKYRDPKTKKMVRDCVLPVIESELPGLPYQQKMIVLEKLVNEISGYGPLDKLLDDPQISEIIVERWDSVVVEIAGGIHDTDIRFDTEQHLRLVIDRILAPLGRRLDWVNPTADARLPDGSRICAVGPPVAPSGLQLTVRKFMPDLSMDELIEFDTLTHELKEFLKACVKARLSIIVSGGTGSGKTTMLNALSKFIDHKLLIITIENPIELQLDHPHVRQWEARPENIEGKGEISMLSLVNTALRSSPRIIIVGEVRGEEAFALMQALNTGHDGSMTTLHANSAADATQRLVSMVSAANKIAPSLVPSFIASGVDLIIQLKRMADNSRKLTEVAEVVGVKGEEIIVNPLIKYQIEEFTKDGIKGSWAQVNKKFHRLKRIREMGMDIPGWEEA